MEPLFLFAVLPFGLLSLFDKELRKGGATAGFGFLAALAPVVAKGISSLIGHKQQKSSAKQAEEQRKLEAQQADALAKQQWEAQQNSPSAQLARFKSTMQLGRLAGGLGGLSNVPKSLMDYYTSARTMPTYSGVSSYVPTAQKGGTGWDIAAGVADALQYLDTSKFKRGGGGTPGQTPPIASTPMTSSTPTLNAGLITNRYIPFDPKLGRG